MILFVGERRSSTAIRMGVRWKDGRLAAKQLFDALKHCGISPNSCQFVNWWERGTHQVVKHQAAKGVTVVAMGRKVQRELLARDIPHLFIFHPAARGAIRLKARYFDHVKSILGRSL